MEVKILNSIDEFEPLAYREFCKKANAPLFYERKIIEAAERFPLLPVLQSHYIAAFEKGELVAFLPCYLQLSAQIDPFKLLKRTANVNFTDGDKGLFGHIMHCYETRIICTCPSKEIYVSILDEFYLLAERLNARYCGLINVSDPMLCEVAQAEGYNINFMVDRYYKSLSNESSIDSLIQGLPREGRQEMNRQLRRFDLSGATVSVQQAPLTELKEITNLCQQTTARHGTPDYFPAAPLLNFVTHSAENIRLIKIHLKNRLIAAFICFQQEDTLHLWSAGTGYEDIDFSPYTIIFKAAYEYALAQGLQRVEAGRLNARIKERLGLTPLALYSVTRPVKSGVVMNSQSNDLKGIMINRDSVEYDQYREREIWNGAKPDRDPALVIIAEQESDIDIALEIARSQGQKLSVKVSGHSYSVSFMRSNSLLLDLSKLCELSYDEKEGVVVAQPGVTNRKLTEFLKGHGRAFPVGHAGDVSLSGYLLGGGVGINSRAWGGMAVFNLLAVDLVLADGTHRHASDQENTDLFWAARGGASGLFFIVTRFYLRTYPLPQCMTANYFTLPFTSLPALGRDLALCAIKTDPSLQIMVAIVPSGEGSDNMPIVLVSSFAFSDNAEHARLMHRELAQQPSLDKSGGQLNVPLTFEDVFVQGKGMLTSACVASDNLMTDDLKGALAILGKYYGAPPSKIPLTLIMWRGKQDFPDAMYSMQGDYFISTYAQWDLESEEYTYRSWLKDLYDELGTLAQGHYINEFDQQHRSVKPCFTEENWVRFKSLREQFDPASMFPGFLKSE